MASCDLCPRGCRVDRARGQMGLCGCGEEAIVAHQQLHLWEEPPISAERGSGTVFFAGCPLQCVFCQNARISRSERGRPWAPSELAQAMLELQQSGAHNINLVTPTHFAPAIREAIRFARGDGLAVPIIWNTSGYETVDAIEANRGLVDIYLTDFKYADAGLAAALSGAPDYAEVAMAALETMVESVGAVSLRAADGVMSSGVIVRHLILPGHTDDSKSVVQRVHDRFGTQVRLSLMGQYTPVIATCAKQGDIRAQRALSSWPELGRLLHPEEYEEVLAFADDLGVEDYFWQDGEAASESFIPEFNV